MLSKTPFQRIALATRFQPFPRLQRRQLLTLAIETSCDDTAVAILEKNGDKAILYFNEKISCNNAPWQGIHPLAALASHRTHLAKLVAKAIKRLPKAESAVGTSSATGPQDDSSAVIARNRRKPDFISVTRGPGMLSSLSVGIDTAKGLAVAWQIPILGVHHMQAHALTPRLQHALEAYKQEGDDKRSEGRHGTKPGFPFLSLLVSGGHTLLLRSTSLTSHKILATTVDIALGDCLDKAARLILPSDALQSSGKPMFGPLLEEFAWPTTSPTQQQHKSGDDDNNNSEPARPYDYNYNPPTTKSQDLVNATTPTPYGWTLSPPLMLGDGGKQKNKMAFSFAGINTYVDRVVNRGWDWERGKLSLVARGDGVENENEMKEMGEGERRLLAREVMRVTFEHLASRVLLALGQEEKEGEEGTEGGSTSSSSTLTPPSNPTTTSSSSSLAASAPSSSSLSSKPKTKTLVLSGGVASNAYLRHILTSYLSARGFPNVRITAPPVYLCTDNAAMIAWAGCEMFEAGYCHHRRSPLHCKGEPGGGGGSEEEKEGSEGLQFMGLRKWSLENLMSPEREEDGVLGDGSTKKKKGEKQDPPIIAVEG